jgi:cytoskeletal protein RodZ
VFNRGFVRSVSRFLGLDEDALIAEYALVTNDTPEVAVWATEEKSRRNRGPLVAALVLVALGVGGYFAWQQAAPWLGPQVADLWSRVTGSRSSGVAAADQRQSPESTAPAAAASAAAPSAATGELELKLEAGKPTVVTVYADGVNRFDGRIEKDAKHTFHAREKFEITARDPSALVVTLNGQEVPPFGFPGQPGSKTLTRADLKPGGQP